MSATLKTTRDQVEDTLANMRARNDAEREGFNLELEPEFQTDKVEVKLAPCRGCHRPLVVTRFYAPAKALCGACKGGTTPGDQLVGKPIPGKTDPAKAVNLAECLINPQFAYAVCPFDAEHTVELKNVVHAPHYGPRRLVGYDGRGIPKYNVEVGESVMHQCNECKAVISYSTQHAHVYRRQNEVRTNDLHTAGDRTVWHGVLGVRDEENVIPPEAIIHYESDE